MKLNKKQTLIIIAVFALMVATVAVQSVRTYHAEISAERDKAALNAKAYSAALEKDFERGVAITENLNSLIIDNNGNINHFDRVAKDMMQDYIGSIQLAPDGVVTKIYPMKGNEAGLGDLMTDPDRGPVVQYGKAKDKITMQGPFKLWQGDQGIAIRNPVYLTDNSGNQKFWGFTIVIIKVPEIYESTLDALSSFGYDYCLDTTVSPLSQKSARVSASVGKNEKLDSPEGRSFRVGGCTWTLNVEPTSGWKSQKAMPIALGGMAFAVLITLMSYLLLGLYSQHEKLKEIANKDALTGLMSRRALMESIREELKERPNEPMTAVFIDLDDFKQINDVYGHMVGDEALQKLASNLRESLPENTYIGRSGGDEFCVLIPGKTAEECGHVIEEAACNEHSFTIGSKEYGFTISAGYADYPAQAQDRKHLLTLADQALYAAKVAGKNRCMHYEPSMSGIRRSQLGFSAKDITSGIPGAFLIYKARGDEDILFANEDMIQMCGCDDFNDFHKYTGGNFRGMVHPDDADRISAVIWKQINDIQAKTGKKQKYYDDFVEYRIITKSGEEKTVFDVGRLVETEKYGDLFFVFIRDKVDLDKTQI